MIRSSAFILSLALFGVFSAFADLDGNGEDERPVQRRVVQRPPAPARQMQPPAPQYQEDTFEQLRNLNGRVDVIENQLNQINAASAGEKGEVAKAKKELEGKFVAYEEALKKMEMQIAALSDEVAKMREDLSKKSDKREKPEAKNGGKKGSGSDYDRGEALLAQKKWREAIIAYEDYRKARPKGKHYADATYKIGVCMQEVGMRSEAKLFYDEVIAKFPRSKEAKKAAYRLKTIK